MGLRESVGMKCRAGILVMVTCALMVECTPSGTTEKSGTPEVQADSLPKTDTSSTTSSPVLIELTSKTFHSDSTIPAKYTCDGANVSPHLAWGLLPHYTKTLTIICEDIDAPGGPWTHWVIYNIPPAQQQDLPENIPQGLVFPNDMRQGLNDFGKLGWGGPCPPPGKPHQYVFRLYLLDAILHLPGPVDKAAVMRAMEGHIIGEGRLVGVYGR